MYNKDFEKHLQIEALHKADKAKTRQAIRENLMEIEILQDNKELSQEFKAWLANLKLKQLFKLNNLNDYLL